ncbi:MAG: DNA glycosylase [Clostridia bacterium]|nr:DNA glycosylase [Clostridia bacterium]MDD4375631.1 DNA glycosylase [Clostridia bacterium]
MLKLKVKCFNLKYTLECGQCFRWKCVGENQYVGVIKDRVIDIKQVAEEIIIKSNKEEELEKVVKEYFDFEKDYGKIENEISKIDDNIKKAVKYSSGIRILNQDLFETLISYIISANNNIKRISNSINKISEKFGKTVEYNNVKYFLFPELEELKKATIEELVECGVGYRAVYIVKTINMINNQREFEEKITNMDRKNMKEVILKFSGVGPKVADCILLFSLKQSNVFPIDVWVKRIMEKLYFSKEMDIKEISAYSKEKYGNYAGIIQQHLFYNVREGNI